MFGSQGEAVPEITATELEERLRREHPLVLVDVRETYERSIADLPDVGQRHIPVQQLPARIGELDPDDTLVLYCRSGARSEQAARFLLDRGYPSVYNLTGGVLAWREEVDPSLTAY